MEKIKQFFKKIGSDGLLHFFVCFSITAILGNFVNIGLAAFAGIFIGFFKEIIWDAWLKKGSFQWKDLWCDIAGSISAFLILLLTLL